MQSFEVSRNGNQIYYRLQRLEAPREGIPDRLGQHRIADPGDGECKFSRLLSSAAVGFSLSLVEVTLGQDAVIAVRIPGVETSLLLSGTRFSFIN